MNAVDIRPIEPSERDAALDDLVALLEDAVDSGGSVGFLSPVDRERVAAYWRARIDEVAAGTRVLLVAREGGRIVGSVQLAFASQENGAHRAEAQRLLVHSSSRRRGIGTALLLRLEESALRAGRTLLVANTRAGDPPEALYRRLGYVFVGHIPEYARNPDGTFNTTSIMYRRL